MKNKIIVFANQKGGTGKTTLCTMMANWLSDHKKNVVVYDADTQQNLYDHRKDESQVNPNVKTPWEIKLIDSTDITATNRELDVAAEYKGYVIIDAPGALLHPGLASILQVADAIIIPFSYDYNVMKSTSKFLQVLLSDKIGQEKERLFLIPNRIEDRTGTKEERTQNEEAATVLRQLGHVTERVKKSVVMQRVSTLTANKQQLAFVDGIYKGIINKISKLK